MTLTLNLLLLQRNVCIFKNKKLMFKMARVGVNGFGRMGKLLVRTMVERHPTKMVPGVVNDPAINSTKQAAYILKHDSVHGKFYGDVCFDDKHLIVNGNKVVVHKESDINKVVLFNIFPMFVLFVWGTCPGSLVSFGR